MPKFVSGSSGSIYAPKKLGANGDGEDDDAALLGQNSGDSSIRKPSAINKKGTKEKQKNSLDLFKEELRKLNEKREEKRDKCKRSANDNPSPYHHHGPPTSHNYHPPHGYHPPNHSYGKQQRVNSSWQPQISHNLKSPPPQATTPMRKNVMGEYKRDKLTNLLLDIDTSREKVGASMLFCISHSDAALEIVDSISDTIKASETTMEKKLALMFLVSDILNNCSAAVTNASFYRKGFQSKLVSIFENLCDFLKNSDQNKCRAESFKQKILCILGAWKEWTLYEDEFLVTLSNILLAMNNVAKAPSGDTKTDVRSSSSEPTSPPSRVLNSDLDGIELDEATLVACLEAKGLSLRWYNTLELSDDEAQDDSGSGGVRCRTEDNRVKRRHSSGPDKESPKATYRANVNKLECPSTEPVKVKFKTSKWETVDPDEVAEQVVTMSKWDAVTNLHVPEDDTSGETDSSLDSCHDEPDRGYDRRIGSQQASENINKRFRSDK